MAQYNDPGPECCGLPSRKIISRQTIIPPMESYQSPIDGRVIRTKAERQDDLKRNGCRPYEGFHDEYIEAGRRRSYADQAMERQVEKIVESAYKELPYEHKKVLENAI